MIPQTYPSTYESYNDRTSMVVYELTSVIGLQEWIDYIPVKNTLPSESEVNTYANNGAIQIDSLSSSTGLQAWLNYIPVYQKSTGTAWVDYIPVYRSSTFTAVLTNSLLLRNGTGSPTYTRATTATQEDNEQKLNQALSGEARFQGARRVRNRLAAPENLNGSGWTKQAGAVVTQISGSEWEIDISACALNTGVFVVAPNIGPSTARCSVSLRVVTTSGNNTVSIAEPSSGAFSEFNTPVLTSNWVRVASPAFTVPVSGGIWFKNKSGQATVFRIKEPQVEVVTGQSNQAPSEYVSVGVLSSPFHGAMVDGVKYFTTTNGNTVASNVVTEAAGLPISSTTLKGYLAEGARTNLCLQSQDLSTAKWIQSNSTLTANNIAAPDGTTTGNRILETVAVGTHQVIYEAGTPITISSATVYTLSIFAKGGLGRDWFRLADGSGLLPGNAYFNLTTGVVGTVTSGTATIKAYPNGWYLCTVTSTSAGTTCRPQIATADSDGNVSYTGDIAKGLYAWGAQLEAGSFASSYIPTTTASVTRNADVLTYPQSGNISTTQGSAYAEILALWNSGGANPQAIIKTGTTGAIGTRVLVSIVSAADNIQIFDGTNVNFKAVSNFSTAQRKAASSWGSAGLFITAAGATPATTAFDGDLGGAGLAIGSSTDGGEQFYGTIRNVRIYSTQLSASQLQALTS